MSAPVVTVTSYDKIIISRIAGKNVCNVTFTTDQDLIDWVAKAGGINYLSGEEVGKATPIPDKCFGFTEGGMEPFDQAVFDNPYNYKVCLEAGQTGTFEVEGIELNSGDKVYRINVYGKNLQGEWTQYE